MRNRELLNLRIERLEGKLKVLKYMVNRGEDVKKFQQELENSEEILSEIKSMVEREPMSPNEINKV